LRRQATNLKEAPKLAAWAEENLPMGFAVFDLPIANRCYSDLSSHAA
jgi:hypothetical protein